MDWKRNLISSCQSKLDLKSLTPHASVTVLMPRKQNRKIKKCTRMNCFQHVSSSQERSGSSLVFSTGINHQYEGNIITLNVPNSSGLFVFILSLGLIINVINSCFFFSGIQPKQLRKLIQQTFQQYSTLNEEQCIMKFFETFSVFSSFDEEVYPCELVVRPL